MTTLLAFFAFYIANHIGASDVDALVQLYVSLR